MVYQISESLGIARVNGTVVVQCTKCGTVICDAQKRWKDFAPRLTSPLTKAGPRRSSSGRFEMREYICANCATILDVEVALPGDEPIYDQINIATIPKSAIGKT